MNNQTLKKLFKAVYLFLKNNSLVIIFGIVLLLFLLSRIENCNDNRIIRDSERFLSEREDRIDTLRQGIEQNRGVLNKVETDKSELREQLRRMAGLKEERINEPVKPPTVEYISLPSPSPSSASFTLTLDQYLKADEEYERSVSLIIKGYEETIEEKDSEIDHLKELRDILSRRKKRFSLVVGPGVGVSASGRFYAGLNVTFGFVVK